MAPVFPRFLVMLLSADARSSSGKCDTEDSASLFSSSFLGDVAVRLLVEEDVVDAAVELVKGLKGSS